MGISFSWNIFETDILVGDFRLTGTLTSFDFTCSGLVSTAWGVDFDFGATVN